MTEEDEEFQRLEREAKMRRMTDDDDDTQVYKKPWVGLTELERAEIANLKWWDWEDSFDIEGFARAIEQRLKDKNS